MKQQFIYINGGVPKENFSSYYDFLESIEYNPYEEKFQSWNKTLGNVLGDDWEYFRAPFVERGYADYDAWKIMFEKMIPFFNEEIMLGASSLGVTFLLKYMGENDGIYSETFRKKINISKMFLIAGAIEDTPDEKLGSFAFDLEYVYGRVARWSEQIYIYHSQDDDLVPYEQSLMLKQYFPEAIFREFYDRGHFYKESELPEIIEDIKS